MWNPFRRTRAARTGGAAIENLTTPLGWVPPRRGLSAILDGMSEQPWYHAVLGRIADAFVSVQWEVYAPPVGVRTTIAECRAAQMGCHTPEQRAAETKEWPRILDHAALSLLRLGSPEIGGQATKRLAVKHYCGAGEAFLAISRGSDGLPAQLWIFPPQWVRTTPTKYDPFYHIQNESMDERFPKSDMIWIRNHDPKEPYRRGRGTGFSLGDELDSDEYAAKFAKAFFYNNAAPSIVASFEDMDDRELAEARRAIDAGHRGQSKAHRPFVTNRKASIEVIQQDLTKIALTEQRRFYRDTTVQVHGVPPEILGILTSSNRATISAADHIMAKYVTVPLCEAFCEALQFGLADLLGLAVLGYVNPIPEDKEFKLKVATAFPNAVSIREVRAIGGFSDRGDMDDKPAGESPRQAPPDDTDPSAPNARISGTGSAETVEP